jgi:multidrug efflux pump subunit AcrB
MGVIRFSIAQPLLVNLMLVLVLIGGVLAWLAMPQEMFPTVDLDKVNISTVFEGAPPVEVERQITILIEEELDSLPDIDTITSTSAEGVSRVLIELKPGTDVDEFLQDIRDTIDQITDLPDEAEEPKVTRLKTRFPVISLALFGDVAPGYLYDEAERIKRRLQQIPGVASVGVAGDREWEIWVETDPHMLAAMGVSLDTVSQALIQNLRDLPGGSLKAQEGDVILRGMGAAPDLERLERLPLRSNDAGGVLRLSDVAQVQLRLEEAETIGRFNGQPSVNLTVTKTAESSTIDVADRVRALSLQLQEELPVNLNVGVFSDLSVYVRTRLETVKSSGILGLGMVLASLYLFLNFRVAAITAMGIPVSFLVAVIIIYYLGYTINMVSLFAFLIALGMIVDDAIIVTENAYRHLEEGMMPREAAEQGAREVFWPVVASTTTTMAAFLPMFAIGGTLGEFIKVIPIVVSAALLGSLLEAFIVLPSHAAEMLRVERKKRETRIDWSQWLDRYTRVIHWSLMRRYFVAVATIGALIITVALMTTRVPFQLFGQVEVGQFFVNIETPNTYSIDDTDALAHQLEQAIIESIDDDELDTMLTNIGVSFIDFNRVRFGSQYIQLIIDLEQRKPEGFIERFISPVVNFKFKWEGTRERATDDIINAVRERIEGIPGVQRFSILRPQGGPAGADIEIGLVGASVDGLLDHANDLTDALRRIPGVKDVRQDMEPGKLEYRYSINSRGRELGLTQAQIANVVRTGFLGQEVTQVNWGNDRYPVRVIYPDEQRRKGDVLQTLPVTLADGRTVYLGDVAEIEKARGLSTINRRDQRRLATVTAEVDSDITTPGQVTERLEKTYATFAQDNPGYELLYLGEKKEANESMADMKRALLISLAIIFVILAGLFKSLLDPLIVMFAIPFGIIGVVFGHLLFGHNLQFLSMVGFLALTGIIVNDSLILIDFAKKLRAQGYDRVEALVQAGRVRIRPILLTTITTFLGISPLIFFATGQTAFLAPMAVSLGFGLIFATGLILVALPCFYLIADDLRESVALTINRLLPEHA